MPQPFGPMIATISPRSTARSKPSSASAGGSPADARTATSMPLATSRRRLPAAIADRRPREDRRDRRVEADVGVERGVVARRGSSGRGSRRWATRVMPRIAAGRSGYAPIPVAPSDRRPDDRGLEDRRHRDREPGDVGLDLVPRLAPRRPAADPHLVDASRPAARIGSATWRIANADASRIARVRWPAPWSSVSPTNAPRADGSQIGERSPARYGRNSDALGAGRRRGGLLEQRLGRVDAARRSRSGTSRSPGRSRPSPRRR